MNRKEILVCGCSPQGPCCEVGKNMFRVVAMYDAYIKSPTFLLVSFAERERVWDHYYAGVEAYYDHCGYYAPMRPD